MVRRSTTVRRIHLDLDKKLSEFSKKNNMDMVKASQEIAKAVEKLKGRKIKRRQTIEEIRF